LTKLTTSDGQARPIRFENFRIGPSFSNRIESDSRFESNLEASQVPTIYAAQEDQTSYCTVIFYIPDKWASRYCLDCP